MWGDSACTYKLARRFLTRTYQARDNIKPGNSDVGGSIIAVFFQVYRFEWLRKWCNWHSRNDLERLGSSAVFLTSLHLDGAQQQAYFAHHRVSGGRLYPFPNNVPEILPQN
jgi:hypothetical protein